MRTVRTLSVLVVLACLVAAQQTVTLPASKDNTLYESAGGSLSNGAGDGIFAGRNNGQFSPQIIRRGLIAFDVSSIPPGAMVTSVSVRLTLVGSNAPTVSVGLHRVLADWGEGGSVAPQGGGGGGAPQAGDATWLNTFFPGATWSTPGGDFTAASSATASVGSTTGASVVWMSTPQLVADVQAWVANPGTNYGWMLRAPETGGTSAKKFASRESFFPPDITVTYTSPAASVTPTGLGCPAIPGSLFTLTAAGVPSLGNGNFEIEFAGGHPSGQVLVFLAQGLAAAPVPLGGGCLIFIDPVSATVLTNLGLSPVGPLPLDGSGGLTVPAPIPAQASLAGQTLHIQALSFQGAAFATSNALTLLFN